MSDTGGEQQEQIRAAFAGVIERPVETVTVIHFNNDGSRTGEKRYVTKFSGSSAAEDAYKLFQRMEELGLAEGGRRTFSKKADIGSEIRSELRIGRRISLSDNIRLENGGDGKLHFSTVFFGKNEAEIIERLQNVQAEITRKRTQSLVPEGKFTAMLKRREDATPEEKVKIRLRREARNFFPEQKYDIVEFQSGGLPSFGVVIDTKGVNLAQINKFEERLQKIYGNLRRGALNIDQENEQKSFYLSGKPQEILDAIEAVDAGKGVVVHRDFGGR